MGELIVWFLSVIAAAIEVMSAPAALRLRGRPGGAGIGPKASSPAVPGPGPGRGGVWDRDLDG